MNKKYLIVAAVATFLVILVASLLSQPEDAGSALPKSEPPSSTTALQPKPSKPVSTSIPSAKINSANREQEVMTNTDDQFSAAMRANVGQVAANYEKANQYPRYSTPLSTSNWDLMHPQAFVKNQLPVGGDSDVSATLDMPKYVVFHDEPIEVSLYLQSESKLPSVQEMKIEVMDSRKIVAELPLHIVNETEASKHYQSSYEPSSDEKSLWNIDLQVMATIELSDGSETTLVSPFKYSKKHVLLTGVESSVVSGADLIIPLKVEVNTAGRYQFRANLYDESGQPVSHLSIKENLSSFNDDIAFKVHSSLLSEKNAVGPYSLRDFNITKVPAVPGQKTEYGFSMKEQYEVNGFPLEQYSKEPYVDPMNQARLKFLKQLAD